MQNDSARPDQRVHVSPSIPPPAAPVATTDLPSNADVPVTDVQPPAAPVISTLLVALTVLCTGIPQLKDVDVRGLRKWSKRLNQMHEEWEDKSGAGIEEEMRVQAMVTKAREVLLTGLKNKISANPSADSPLDRPYSPHIHHRPICHLINKPKLDHKTPAFAH
jgi:hypothetical protein